MLKMGRGGKVGVRGIGSLSKVESRRTNWPSTNEPF